jgi:hypothetical protein
VSRAPDPFPTFERTGTPGEMDAADANIEALSDKLIGALSRAKDLPAGSNDDLKPEDVRFLAYALAVHRTRKGKVLSEAHLSLLAAALGIHRTSTRAAAEIGLPPVRDLPKFHEAADAEALYPDISENKLAQLIGVANKTIREWREMPTFQARVSFGRHFGDVVKRPGWE